jgi:hypothetical protein
MIVTCLHEFLLVTKCTASIARTFELLFRTQGRGLYTKFLDGRLALFVVFYNPHFRNEWHVGVRCEGGLEPVELLRRASAEAGRPFTDEHCALPTLAQWRRNGNLLRGDSKPPHLVHGYRAFLEGVRDAPDSERFLNVRDFPVECGDVLNMVCRREPNATTPALLPTWDDLSEVKSERVVWEEREAIAIWRGSSTGRGARRVLVSMTRETCLDAHFTSHSTRPYLDGTIVRYGRRGPQVERLSMQEQARRAKFAVCIDGHVSAFRLRTLLAHAFCVLWVESEWEVWYQREMVAFVHYVPVAADLHDLYARIEWCQENDAQCQQIAQQGLAFYHSQLGVDSARAQFCRALLSPTCSQ